MVIIAPSMKLDSTARPAAQTLTRDAAPSLSSDELEDEVDLGVAIGEVGE